MDVHGGFIYAYPGGAMELKLLWQRSGVEPRGGV